MRALKRVNGRRRNDDWKEREVINAVRTKRGREAHGVRNDSDAILHRRPGCVHQERKDDSVVGELAEETLDYL